MRGRLSSIDLLPDEAVEDVVWAGQQLAERRRRQDEILEEFNARLAAKGLGPISKSAFNRRAVFVARSSRRMADMHAVFEGLEERFDANDIDKTNVLLGEYVKTLLFELIEATAAGATTKQAMELARAYASTVSAQKASTERREKNKEAAQAKLISSAETAVAAAEASGHIVDGAAVLQRIREEVYGIFER